MRAHIDSFEPEDLKTLQRIFEAVWSLLVRIGRVHKDDVGVRNWVSSRVIACAKEKEVLDFDAIKTAVLKSLHQ